MILAIDIGNSAVSFGLFDVVVSPVSFVLEAKISANPYRTCDEYLLFLRDILMNHGHTLACIDSVAIASVVPEVTVTLADVAEQITGRLPLLIGPGTHTGLNIRIDSHVQIGADIVANAVAALTLVSPPAVIVDLGTVTTAAVVDQNSALIGAVLCPGLKTSLKAMTDSASLLCSAALEQPKDLIGKNTPDAMNSGLVNGHVYMIDGFIRDLRAKLCSDDMKLSLVATGGLAQYVIPHCRNKFVSVPNLTLFGIAEIYRRSCKNFV